ncbi:hypothetical protein [Nostoc favosum]|uniref:Uncharacterized protein n=1 Tax=Nostoc favosum CHAB5714 TaxID=2780399 RepID=A0ABS8I9A8_9NOSO|nr:hypothetical protein [Nostoc favosum]MCC5600591.1 hypothetical protein [Nostoc favosum CHAB5714]
MRGSKTVLDKAEDFVEIGIFICLIIIAIASLETDFLESAFYIVLAAIISPFTKINKPAKRLLLVSGFLWGAWVGYFN